MIKKINMDEMYIKTCIFRPSNLKKNIKYNVEQEISTA